MQTLILSLLSGDWEEEDDDLRAEQFSISKIVKLYLVVIVIGHYYSQILLDSIHSNMLSTSKSS